MPRPNPELEFEDDDVEFDDFRIRRPPLAWTTTASVSSVLAWGALAAHNIVTMPKLDGVPNVSFDRITGCARFAPRYVSNVSNDSRRRVASPRAVGRANDVIECATFMISIGVERGNETDRLMLSSRARASLSRRSLLFALRVGTFLFGLFFVGYHLVYEESKKRTDGMAYLSDWTILWLCGVEGALGWAMRKTESEPGALDRLTNRLVIAYGVAWSTNLVSSGGAWFSFFAYPMCETLEGVDNYPKCYLEWYRLAEHAFNLVVLLLELLLGAVPMRRRDFGWSILFVHVYVLHCWFRSFVLGQPVVYDMFKFSTGLPSVAWYNGVFFLTSLAFFISLKLHQPRGYRTQGRAAGPFMVERVAGAAESRPLVRSQS